ncbi:AraC family transcriptional regulator [Cellulomonas humilata]|uniref:AraC family transcriptional regulator n=1 Tax=Cellulomonas humilata TaxID=144055 RepID=A0A7Y6A4V3_9CELL|nr:helix-turn-helix domain-containing protein [Cellulomonas humilata]NUU19829.1 AraC family transcriptional regulator [Cellulomonas humilata]
MSFVYDERTSASRYVDVVWHTVDTSDGTYLASADARWDMIFTVGAHGSRVLLSGPSSQPTVVPYVAGNRNLGIRFAPGAYFTHVPVDAMRDRTVALPMPSPDTFVLAGSSWPFPGTDGVLVDARVDALVEALADRGLLARDDVVETALAGDPVPLSTRTVERHFTHTTGMSPRRVRQIARAREAVDRLQRGGGIADVAHALGYADQAHLTRDLKRLTGYTPGQSRDRDEPV